MTGGPFSGVYQRYKEDTKWVATWLQCTAQACGIGATQEPSDVGAESQESGKEKSKSSSTRLKGKARKEARAAAAIQGQNTKTPKSQAPKPSSHVISMVEFSRLAQFIADSQHSDAVVPGVVLDILSRAIDARCEYGSQLEAIKTDITTQAVEGHAHFLQILKNVRQILATKCQTRQGHDPHMRKESPLFTSVSNRFESLAIEEDSASAEVESSQEERVEYPPITSLTEKDTAVEVDTQEAELEAWIEFMMMMVEIRMIRETIRECWVKFDKFGFDLAAVALSTNTAMGLARSLTGKAIVCTERHGGYKTFIYNLTLRELGLTGHNFAAMLFAPERSYEVENDNMVTGHTILRLLQSKVDFGRNFLGYSEVDFDNHRRASQTTSVNEKFSQDCNLVIKCILDQVMMANVEPDFCLLDEFSRSLKDISSWSAEDPPLYAVFATQVFLDINNHLREKTVSCFEILEAHITFFSSEVESFLDSLRRPGARSHKWPDAVTKDMINFHRFMGIIKRDVVFEIRREQHEERNLVLSEGIRHRRLRHSPVLAGLLLYRFRARFHDLGITVANAAGSLFGASYLYKGLQNEGLDIPVWGDMENVLEFVGAKTFFVGGIPTTRDGFVTRFWLQLGASLASLNVMKGKTKARKRKNQGIESEMDVSGRRGRGIDHSLPPMHALFQPHYVYNDNQVDWTPEFVAKIVEKCDWRVVKADSLANALDQIHVELMSSFEETKGKSKRIKKSGNDNGANLPPGVLLKLLLDTLQSEATELAFPYLYLHRVCWDLLGTVRDGLANIIQDGHEERVYATSESALFSIAFDILSSDRMLRDGTPALINAFRGLASTACFEKMEAVGFDFKFKVLHQDVPVSAAPSG